MALWQAQASADIPFLHGKWCPRAGWVVSAHSIPEWPWVALWTVHLGHFIEFSSQSCSIWLTGLGMPLIGKLRRLGPVDESYQLSFRDLHFREGHARIYTPQTPLGKGLTFLWEHQVQVELCLDHLSDCKSPRALRTTGK